MNEKAFEGDPERTKEDLARLIETRQNLQSNSVRLVYCMVPRDAENYRRRRCNLINGFALEKRPRSDELLRYTERDIRSIVRTIMFMHVFPDLVPADSLHDMVFIGNEYRCVSDPTDVLPSRGIDQGRDTIPLSEFVTMLDRIIGQGFCRVTRHSLTEIYHEYMNEWRYYGGGQRTQAPSTRDYVRLARFVNATTCRYSKLSEFVNRNADDNKIQLQTRTVNLDEVT